MRAETIVTLSHGILFISGVILIGIAVYIKNTNMDLTPYFYNYLLITGIWSMLVALCPESYLLFAFGCIGIFCLRECLKNLGKPSKPVSPIKKDN